MSETMIQPTMFGEPLYPGGFPLQVDNYRYEDKTMCEIYCNAKRSEKEEQVLKDYIIYYINAPIYDSEFTNELRNAVDRHKPLDVLISACLEYGLDPL